MPSRCFHFVCDSLNLKGASSILVIFKLQFFELHANDANTRIKRKDTELLYFSNRYTLIIYLHFCSERDATSLVEGIEAETVLGKLYSYLIFRCFELN